MGDVIDLTTRLPAPPEPGQAEPETPTLSAIPETSIDTGKIPVSAPGVGRRFGTAARRYLKIAGHRAWFETTHVPHRGFRILRYVARGVIGRRDPDTGVWGGGWIALLGWCFAARERRDAHALAAEKPGAELRGTQTADHIAAWHSGLLIGPHAIGAVALAHNGLPPWLILLPLVIATAIYGYRIEPKPPTPIAAPRTAGNITVDAINEALRAVLILAKPSTQNPHPDGVKLARMPRTVGGGQEAVIDLPASIKASSADVIKERERIAASLAVPLHQLIIEPGDHAGRVVLWYADRDPFAGNPVSTPLLDATSWSVFDRVPFGHDSRGEPVTAPIFETTWLVGGLPGSGKTTAARAVAAAAVLDPNAELYVLDGKQGADWAAIEPAAEVFDAGPIRDQAARLRYLLETVLEEGDQRFHRMRQLPAHRCPDNRLTPELAATGMPFRLLIVDEFHRHLADEQHGQAITNLLVDYVKGYRAAGYGLLLCTQDAGSDIAGRFTSLRRVIGTRWCGRVMDWAASNMILGDEMNTRGYNASLILPAQRGTGILRTDLEADTGTSRLARQVRAYNMTAEEWAALCKVGAELRRQRADEADGDQAGGPRGLLTLVVQVLTEHGDLSASGLLEHLPEPWSGLAPDQLGLELQALGLRSTRTHSGRRYRIDDASQTLARTRHDPVTPLTRRDGVAGDRDGSRDGDATGPATGSGEPARPTGTED